MMIKVRVLLVACMVAAVTLLGGMSPAAATGKHQQPPAPVFQYECDGSTTVTVTSPKDRPWTFAAGREGDGRPPNTVTPAAGQSKTLLVPAGKGVIVVRGKPAPRPRDVTTMGVKHGPILARGLWTAPNTCVQVTNTSTCDLLTITATNPAGSATAYRVVFRPNPDGTPVLVEVLRPGVVYTARWAAPEYKVASVQVGKARPHVVRWTPPQTCGSPSPTPTPTVTASPTPTATVTASPSPSTSPSTPAPSGTAGSPTPVPTRSSDAPTLPVTGSPAAALGVIGGVIFAAGAALMLAGRARWRRQQFEA